MILGVLDALLGGLILPVSYTKIFSFQGLITAVVGALIVLIVYGFIRRQRAS